MRLKEARRAAGLTQKEAAGGLPGTPKQFDAVLLRKCEAGVVVPLPATLRGLADRYGVTVSDLYTAAELDYGLQRPKQAKSCADGKSYYKLTVKLDTGLANSLMDALSFLGIDGPTAWVKRYAKMTIRRAEKKKTAARGNDTDSGKENNNHPHYRGQKGESQDARV